MCHILWKYQENSEVERKKIRNIIWHTDIL